MTNRLQILRSSVTGNTPTAGTRAAGELWTNFADLQLGMIDASRNAQRLVAVRYFSTTANYATGDFVIQAGALYAAKGAVTAGAFNASQWVKVAAATDPDGPYLALAGGTLTGLLTLSGPPSNALHAATKAYADSLVASGPYLPIAGGTLTGLVTLSGPPSAPLHAATKAYVDAGAFVPAAGGANTSLNDNRLINGNFAVNQRVYVSGTAIATTVYGHDRWKAGAAGCTYTFTTALPDTTITITAGTLTQIVEAGVIEGGVYTLSWTGTAQARVYQGSPSGSYATSPVTTASLTAGTNTIVEFNAGTVTRGKLEIGSVATPYNRQSLAQSLADCQRYYQAISVTQRTYAAAVNPMAVGVSWPQMRASPTTALLAAGTRGNVSSVTVASWSANSGYLSSGPTTTGDTYVLGEAWSLSAEL